MKKVILFCAISMFSAITISAQEQTKVTNQTVNVVSGPGSYYEILVRLYTGNEVLSDSIDGFWERISFDDINGWVPGFSLSIAESDNGNKSSSEDVRNRSNSIFSSLSGVGNSETASANTAQVAAAVKGFSDKYRQSRGILSGVDLFDYIAEPFTTQQYLRFLESRFFYNNLDQAQRLLYPAEPYVDMDLAYAEQVGFAVATVIAQEGLVQTRSQTYLNMLATYLVSLSHRPDLRVNVFVMDSDDIVGYALPGNYIFISKGAINAMTSEDQLVHFLGHEIAHIIFGHGAQEVNERETKINAEDAFMELRMATRGSNEMTDLEASLNDMADDLYDYINKDRLETYETEADYWGIVYTYLAGYNPYAIVDFLNIIKENEVVGMGEWNGITVDKRLRYLNSNYSSLGVTSKQSRTTNDFNKLKQSF